jgi:hypothetical protein
MRWYACEKCKKIHDEYDKNFIPHAKYVMLAIRSMYESENKKHKRDYARKLIAYKRGV